MVVVSYSGKEINAKLVYYGAGLSGKTTNLEAIYEAVPETSRGKMVSMKTQSDRTLFFDLLPLDLGEIMGFKTRFLLYTVPGQVFYNATRKLVLKGADAIVFVADSAIGKMDENIESLQNLRQNLSDYGLRLEDIPWVLQYNKRDLPNVYSIDELNASLNAGGAVPVFEAVACQGTGVFETFRGISHLLMQKVTRELHRSPQGAAAAARMASRAAVEVQPQPQRQPEPVLPEAAPASPVIEGRRVIDFTKPTTPGAPAGIEPPFERDPFSAPTGFERMGAPGPSGPAAHRSPPAQEPPSLAFEIDRSAPTAPSIAPPPSLAPPPRVQRPAPPPARPINTSEEVLFADEPEGLSRNMQSSRPAPAPAPAPVHDRAHDRAPSAPPKFEERTIALGGAAASQAPARTALEVPTPAERGEVVIPITVPPGESREIVLRITIRTTR